MRIQRDRLWQRVRACDDVDGGVHTWTDAPLGLETGHAGEAGHGEEVEEYLGGVEYDGRFRDDHLWAGESDRVKGETRATTASHTTHNSGTKRRRTSVPDWSMETTNDYVKGGTLASGSCVLLNRRGRTRSRLVCSTSRRGMVDDEDEDEDECRENT